MTLTKDQLDLQILQKCRRCPWEFSKYVRTIDEVDKVQPIKQFPYWLAYIKATFKILQNERLLLVPKSRRMKMTWTCIVYFLWDTMFHEGRHTAITSKKEDDADWLLRERFKFVYDNLKDTFPSHLLPKMVDKYCLLNFPELKSKLQGFPQGEAQLRMYTFSNIFADEFAFWEKAEATWGAAKPTTDGGGNFVAISSTGPGFFKKLVFDRADDDGLITESDTERMDKTTIMRGLKFWRNQRNGFSVLEVHYSADPHKRSEEFKQEARRGISKKKFLQEYEMYWDTYSGQPVYPDFNQNIHLSSTKLYPHIGLTLLRGWDFGLTPACVVAQLQGSRLVVLKEYTATNMGVDKFSDQILPQMLLDFPQWTDQKEDYMDFIDASGMFREDTVENTCFKVLVSKGLAPKAGDIVWEKRRQGVENYLSRLDGGSPAFEVNETECPLLVKGFKGGYRYPEQAMELEVNKIRPIKDEHSHIQDALQMIASKIKLVKRNVSRKGIPPQFYGFLKRN